jgi:hypothetical protein
MRVIGGASVVFANSEHIGARTIVIDSGGGVLWKVSSAFEGKGLHIRPEIGSVGEVMHVYPIDRESVQLVQQSPSQREWWEDRLDTLELAVRRTIEENKHLADGNGCTLHRLVDAINTIDAEV